MAFAYPCSAGLVALKGMAATRASVCAIFSTFVPPPESGFALAGPLSVLRTAALAALLLLLEGVFPVFFRPSAGGMVLGMSFKK